MAVPFVPLGAPRNREQRQRHERHAEQDECNARQAGGILEPLNGQHLALSLAFPDDLEPSRPRAEEDATLDDQRLTG